MKRAGAYLVAGTFLAVTATLAFSADKANPDGKGLFESKCGVCHSIDRPKSKNKSAAEWEKTVMRMKSNGSKITNDEAKAIIDYLAKDYGEKK